MERATACRTTAESLSTSLNAHKPPHAPHRPGRSERRCRDCGCGGGPSGASATYNRDRRRTRGVQSLATSAPQARICAARAARRRVRGGSTAARASGVVREPRSRGILSVRHAATAVVVPHYAGRIIALGFTALARAAARGAMRPFFSLPALATPHETSVTAILHHFMYVCRRRDAVPGRPRRGLGQRGGNNRARASYLSNTKRLSRRVAPILVAPMKKSKLTNQIDHNTL